MRPEGQQPALRAALEAEIAAVTWILVRRTRTSLLHNPEIGPDLLPHRGTDEACGSVWPPKRLCTTGRERRHVADDPAHWL